MRFTVVLLGLPVLVSCSTLQSIGHAPRKQTDDEGAIVHALAGYCLYCGLSGSESREATEKALEEKRSKSENWFERFLVGWAAELHAMYGSAISDEVRAQLVEDHAHLCALFGVDPQDELEVEMVTKFLEVHYPKDYTEEIGRKGVIDSAPPEFELSRRELRDWRKEGGRLRVNSVMDGEVEKPEAYLSLEIRIFPEDMEDSNRDGAETSCFRQARVLQLAKDPEWRVVAVDVGELSRGED